MKRALALFLMVALLSPPLPALASEQTIPNGVQRIGAANPTDTPLDYAHVNVAVVDTGIDLHNPDLNVVGGVDCTEPSASPFSMGAWADLTFSVEAYRDQSWAEFSRPNVSGYDDGLGHGTHVAGIIAARDDGRGVVGVAPGASLWSVRVLGAGGSGSISNIVCGLDWIHQNRDLIDVVNMSLGADIGEPVAKVAESCGQTYEYAPVYLPQPDRLLADPLHEAICRLVDDGIPVVVAAGNGEGLAEHVIPAAYEEVIAVSSFVDNDGLPGGLGGRNDEEVCGFGGRDDLLFMHANFTPERDYASYNGQAVDIAAPGVCVLSTVPGGYASLTGTSMASPHVAGVVARMLGDAGYPERLALDVVGVESIRRVLMENAEPNHANIFRDPDGWWESLVRVIH
jgi:subtilisin